MRSKRSTGPPLTSHLRSGCLCARVRHVNDGAGDSMKAGGGAARRRVRLVVVAALLVAGSGCGDEIVNPAPPACYDDEAELTTSELCEIFEDACPAVGAELGLSDAITVVPNDTMPPGVVSQPAHNNLDIAWHRGRLYFAFRTAPTHFADPTVVLYVVSTSDQRTWTLETSFTMEKDLREPRFLTLGDKLFLYFARLQGVRFTFVPEA